MAKQFKDAAHREKVIDRIQKLLAIADPNRNCYEGEMQTALRMAKNYMSTYGLSMSEVEIRDCEDSEIDEVYSERCGVIRQWERILAMAVAEACDVKAILRKAGHAQLIRFVGFVDDIEMAKSIFDRLCVSIRSMAVREYNDVHRQCSYMLGVSERLYKRSKDESNAVKVETVSYGALIVVKQARVDKWISEHVGKLHYGSRPTSSYDNKAFMHGLVDGGNVAFDNRKKVANAAGA